LNDNVVETVKDGDDDFKITLNDEEDDEKNDDDSTDTLKDISKNSKDTKVESSNKENCTVKVSDVKELEKRLTSPLPPLPQLTPAPGIVVQVSNPGKMPMLISQPTNIPNIVGVPAGVHLAQQGSQLGYITSVGNQPLFVPISMSNVSPAVVKSQTSSVSQKTAPKVHTTTSPAMSQNTGIQPKSSMEMVELMRWEIQNRVPDNYNWSVAFHPRKEDLSSVTSFLQELGSDVVKEQVYKDIIQIQTKKKDSGELKDAEVESLEKMKTVYENTKKKVEHLQLDTLSCKKCDFKTESPTILEFHKDFPHYDPPWDVNKGFMECSHCNFRTRVLAQFIYHMMVHKRQAKFIEKDQYFQCSLCPLNANTKAKLEKHQAKCVKHFKLNVNLQPYYHDINFCMKNCYFKTRKPPPPKPPLQVKVAPQKPVAAVPTRAQSLLNQPPVMQPKQMIRAPGTSVLRPQGVPQLHQRPTLSAVRSPVPVQTAVRPNKPNAKEMSVFEVCEMCGGYVKDRQALRIHFYYAHKVELPQAIFQRDKPPLQCDVCKAPFWTTQGLSKHRTMKRHFSGQTAPNSAASLGTNQSCFMCLRKVSNLFLHVEQTHGMTMKDLVLMKKCIICGITAADRKALEVHMASTHGVLIKAGDFVNDKATNHQKNVSSTNNSGPKPAKNIGKINFCVFCVIQFSDNIQLTVHCMKKHATCKECGMVVPNATHLDKHKCMKANRRCYICGQSNMTPDSYAVHLKRHVKTCKVGLENLSPEQIEKAIEKLKREYKPAVISLDSDEDSEVEVVEFTNDSKPAPLRKKKFKAATKTGEKKDENSCKEETPEKPMEVDENNEKVADVKSGSLEEKSDESDIKNKVDKDQESAESDCKNESEVKQDNGAEKSEENNDGSDDESKNEVIDEDKLLANDDDSNTSNASGKRKKPDSDIDEDELLRDDTEAKRPKLEINEEAKEKLENVEMEDKERHEELLNDEAKCSKLDKDDPEKNSENVEKEDVKGRLRRQ